MRTNRCGSSGARSATSCERSARNECRPRVRMWAMSTVMQPAIAKPSACTGDGPAAPALSIVIDVLWLVPENFRSPIQVRSTTVGGFDTQGLYCGLRRLQMAGCDYEVGMRTATANCGDCRLQTAGCTLATAETT